MILDFQAWRGRLPPCGTVNMMENTVNHPRTGFVLVLACRGEDGSSKKPKNPTPRTKDDDANRRRTCNALDQIKLAVIFADVFDLGNQNGGARSSFFL
jgi:hypothetical protein